MSRCSLLVDDLHLMLVAKILGSFFFVIITVLLCQLLALHVAGLYQFHFVLFLVNAERTLYRRPCSQNVLKCLLWQYFKV